MASHIKGKHLVLMYLHWTISWSNILFKKGEGKENALYYLNWTLIGTKETYSPVENCAYNIRNTEVAPLPPASSYKDDLQKQIPSVTSSTNPPRSGGWQNGGSYSNKTASSMSSNFLTTHPISNDSSFNTTLPNEEVMVIPTKKGW